MPSYSNRAVRPPMPLEEDYETDEPVMAPRPSYRVAGTGSGLTPRTGAFMPPPAVEPQERELAPAYPPRPRRPNIPSPATRPASYPAERTSRMPSRAVLPTGNLSRWAVTAGAVVVVLIISYLVVSTLLAGWQNWQDDQTYGRPRLTRLEAKVGHNETGPDSKTLFLAQNLNGQVSIIEIPGEDPSQTRVIVGPQLFGKDRDLVPIKLSVADVNGDNLPDLIATVQEQKLIYINEKGNFRPITDAERAKLAASGY